KPIFKARGESIIAQVRHGMPESLARQREDGGAETAGHSARQPELPAAARGGSIDRAARRRAFHAAVDLRRRPPDRGAPSWTVGTRTVSAPSRAISFHSFHGIARE
ncbi:MAG: hypothetical protein AB7I32_13790, partial [Gammaproteobacteria bacterium]